MSDSGILTEVRERIALLTLNRPERLNAWDGPMRDAIARALAAFNADPAVAAVIVTGAGDRAFCAGQDLSETQKFASGEQGSAWFRSWQDFYDAFRGLDKPLIAALNGVAAGSAYQVAMLTDVRVGHPGSRMGQPEINAGIPTVLGTWLMHDRIGFSRTVELVLTGRIMDGRECHDIGLIHYLVPKEQVLPKAREIAAELAAKPPIAMRLNKRRFRELTQPGFDDAIAAGGPVNREAFGSGEPQAYMEKFFAERAKRKKKA